MTRSVTALFAHQQELDSAVGALRTAGFAHEQIAVEISPLQAGATAPEAAVVRRHWFGALLHRGDPSATEGPAHLVTVMVTSDREEGSARNVLVTAGASKISNSADGKMVSIERAADGLTR